MATSRRADLAQQQLICSTLTRPRRTSPAMRGPSGQTLAETSPLMASYRRPGALAHGRQEATWTHQHTERMDQDVGHIAADRAGRTARRKKPCAASAAVARLGGLADRVDHPPDYAGHRAGRTDHAPDPHRRRGAPRGRRSDWPVAPGDFQQRRARQRAAGRTQPHSGNAERTAGCHQPRVGRAARRHRLAGGILGRQRSTAARQPVCGQGGGEAAKLSDIAAHVTSSAVEVSSLSECLWLGGALLP